LAQDKNELAMIKRDTVDVVADKVKQFQENGEVHFPANYSPENAMKSAWLTLQNTQDRSKKPALEVCTKDSIANALLDMVVQGLNPAKKQGYFIVYGNQLVFQRSYFGSMAVTKQVTGAKSIDASPIYEGDEVDYEMVNGRVTNLKHKQKFGNINKENIMGAYATITFDDDNVYHELMTMEEIRQAWSQSQMWGKDQTVEKKGSTHDNFKQEMVKKTVINRACKKFMNSSNDSSLVMNHFNRQDEVSEEAKWREEVNENANGDVIDIEYQESPEETNNEQGHTQNHESDLEQATEEFEKQQSSNGGPGF